MNMKSISLIMVLYGLYLKFVNDEVWFVLLSRAFLARLLMTCLLSARMHNVNVSYFMWHGMVESFFSQIDIKFV